MDNIQEVFNEIGLSKNEIKIYLYLLKKGDSTTGPIIKETKIANSRVYETLNSLISKGFVTFNLQKSGKHFQAENPKRFLEIAEENKKRIQEVLPDLQKIIASSSEDYNFSIYTGNEGFRTAFRKIIDDCPREGTILVLGFSEQADKNNRLRDFLIKENLRSQKKKQRLRILLDENTRKSLGKDREKEKYSEVKYLPKGYVSPSAIDIFEDYVYVFLWGDKPAVIRIKNKQIAESFKNYFKVLWSIAKS